MCGSLDPDQVALALGNVVAEAGRYLASVADRRAGHALKPDGSPATAADVEAERLIVARLSALFPTVGIVAEESGVATPLKTTCFFLVDPLDGTRDYVSGSGEYSVNVALVAGTRPVAAALAAPALDALWIAGRTALRSSFRENDLTRSWQTVKTRTEPPGGMVALTSRRHGDRATESILAALPIARRRVASSAAKFGLVACGEADLYLRCGPTMEWDTAAGDHIVTAAGGCVLGPDRKPLRYGKATDGYRNGPFAATGDPATGARLALPAT